MYEVSSHIDVMVDPEDLLKVVGDLTTRGHYFPDGVIGMRQMAERPPSATEKFLPGQRIAFVYDGESREHQVTTVDEWERAEALIVESRVRSPKGEVFRWRLSELTMGTYRVTLTFAANYGMLEKVSKGNAAKAFITTTLERLKEYIEDKRSYAGVRTFVSQSAPSYDPLDMP